MEPTQPEFHASRASACMQAGNYSAAAEAYATAVRLRPGWFEALGNLGIALARLGRHVEAEAALRAALALRPDSEPVLTTLAATLRALGRKAEAVDAGRRAVEAGPGRPEAWCNLGVVLQAQGQLAEAADAYLRALDIEPRFALALYNLSHVRNDEWQAADALAGFRTAVELDPDYEPGWHALLFNTLYDPDQTEESIFGIHEQWGRRFESPAEVAAPPSRDSGGLRRIRVGYVSPDFRGHSCAYFLRPLFAEHDREAVEIFAYSAVRRPDSFTEWFRQHADHWREVAPLADDTLAQLVRTDQIDVLVDLAGHTLDQPIGVFARRPAPVQIAWLGYPATSGLRQIDYRLTDLQADPPGDADRLHTERLIRLSGGFLCYGPPDGAPEVSSLPASRHGFVTFGSYNNLSKVTLEVIATWAEILRSVPRSRLLLKGRMLANDAARSRIVSAFVAAGVDADRVVLRNWLPTSGYSLAVYNEVDIALDTYPYNGATTTFEALWMGIPVVTLSDQRHAGRVGASILTHLGRPEWIAQDADSYVGIAGRLAADLPGLASIRSSLRGELARSSLTDARGFARKIEKVYREVLCSRQ